MSADHELSQWRQCALLRLTRSGLNYRPAGESAENLAFMAIIDKQFLETPWYGSRQPFGTFLRNALPTNGWRGTCSGKGTDAGVIVRAV
ncbi:MAG TPA: hypothetical protein ENK80_02350 [Rhodobacterales bacterium]|nr:hypothetical protein [Rhodobacterales bacterium]